MPLFSSRMRHGGPAPSLREYSVAKIREKDPNFFSSPLNTSATREDISHVLKIVQPTHVATIQDKLSTVQDALDSLSMTTTKILTVRCKAENLPQVYSPLSREADLGSLTTP